MKIKTLNDFKIVLGFGSGQGVKLTDSQIRKLREEAIKAIKFYETLELPKGTPEEVRDYAIGMVIDYIKHFNNLTDNDLK